MSAEFLQSPLLAGEGFRHAFFTRRGGHSPPPFDSLHFGTTGHDPEDLVANLRAAAEVIGIEPTRLYLVTQVHGHDAVAVRGNEAHADVLLRMADVIVSGAPGVACGIRIADCVPVLVADRKSGAVAAIHSGWQGTSINVVASGVAALRHALGGDGDLLAAIGPHIEICCFEVSNDIADRLCACAPESLPVDRARGRRRHVDLRKIVRAQLAAVGVRDPAIDDVRGCTRCDSLRYFSYRRDRAKSGRLLAAIAVR